VTVHLFPLSAGPALTRSLPCDADAGPTSLPGVTMRGEDGSMMSAMLDRGFMETHVRLPGCVPKLAFSSRALVTFRGIPPGFMLPPSWQHGSVGCLAVATSDVVIAGQFSACIVSTATASARCSWFGFAAATPFCLLVGKQLQPRALDGARSLMGRWEPCTRIRTGVSRSVSITRQSMECTVGRCAHRLLCRGSRDTGSSPGCTLKCFT
jgi:hypothetical protein